ncbi:MAG: phosphodiester glycosidase family protein [Eubacteriales bacterium]|nr:phosphodiester glycosidase family protein [Eubacteriales bacterium]
MKIKWIPCLLALLTLFSSLAYAQENTAAWAAPCFEGPYDYTYEDADRSIVIQKITGDQSAGLLIDVQLREAAGFHAGAAEGDFEALSSMAQREGAVLAINADDYGTHQYGVIIRDGQCLRVHDTTRHMLAVLPDGSFETVSDRTSQTPEELAQRLQAENVMHTFEFGPVLVENGEAVAFPSSFDVISTRESRREPRTAIGMISPLHYVIVVVDGRQSGYSEGVSLQTLQQLFVNLGVQTAFNLDGGGSSEVWFQGEILNRPAGGHERKLSDCIWF